MRMRIFATLLSFILMLTQVQICCAEEVSTTFRKDIMMLLKITGADALGLQMGVAVSNQIIDMLSKENPDMPEKTIAVIKDEVNQIYVEEMPGLLAEIVPVYAKHFTHEEIKSLIAFYGTPIGKKSIKVMPSILSECMQAGQLWGQSLEQKLSTRLESRIKNEGLDQ